jgi:hypothetical protein
MLTGGGGRNLNQGSRDGNQLATDSLKGQRAKRGCICGWSGGNGRDRSLLTWRDCVLAEAVKSGYEVQFHMVLRLNGGCYGFQKGSPTEDESDKCGH